MCTLTYFNPSTFIIWLIISLNYFNIWLKAVLTVQLLGPKNEWDKTFSYDSIFSLICLNSGKVSDTKLLKLFMISLFFWCFAWSNFHIYSGDQTNEGDDGGITIGGEDEDEEASPSIK